MNARELRRVKAAREAMDDLSCHYTSPRALEGDLEILAAALRELPRRLTGIPRPQAAGLCDILQDYAGAQAHLLDHDAVGACTALQELTDIADYDIPDLDDFAENVEEHLSELRDQLEKLFANLEKRDAAPDN